jgi:hypothetical protein
VVVRFKVCSVKDVKSSQQSTRVTGEDKKSSPAHITSRVSSLLVG